ncbi:MAG TPA: hypothetical protein G4N98_01380 [Thermoflexia bacterium]|nr:hypothetical protein [Thermoflexia bacterium]
MDSWILPVLVLVVLSIVGLTVWLASVLLKDSTNQPLGTAVRQRGNSEDSVLSIRRDERGIWVVQVGGTPYHKLAEVPEPAMRREVVDALKILAGFSREYISREHQAATAQPQEPARAPGKLPQFHSQARPKLSQKPPVFMPRINLAQEIGEILEELLVQHPSLTRRSIYLQDAPDGSISFIVDGESYSAVGDISDLEVQALIRTATRQWEKSR